MHIRGVVKTGSILRVGLLAMVLGLGLAAHAQPKLQRAPLPPPQPSVDSPDGPPPQPSVDSPDLPPSREARFVVVTRLERDARGKLVNTPVGQVLRETRVLDFIAKDLSDLLKLKREVLMRNEACGTANAGYQPATSSIVLCDEYLFQLGEAFSHLKSDAAFRNAMQGGILFTMLHETGHALIDQLELPVLGREEDAVDALATYLVIRTGLDHVALAGADSFAALGELKKARGEQTPLWDAHSLDQQRVYNILCWVYGSNPGRYSYLVSPTLLPPARAGLCPEDYQRMSNTLSKALAPHLRTPPKPAPSKLRPLVRPTAP